ncbi:GntR family transcriptional regulator [Fibrella forsythiae]|uniref:GntR family transcriptional regulator n=1 Tax=Fibrella forsythiae TaxID=2817061 RepID=A0ABS3JDF6_9BACT|nr:GntR family transcriptional regulator [Fibrella forsythiae]MBO0948035.1 GntR family transcriptional regulator [Fibrella forsythiae]
MEFNDKQPIYLQIADYVCEQILQQAWPPGERIPSVRDLGSSLEVNPNTAMRAFDYLQQQNILFNKRGMGYYAADDATERVKAMRRARFLDVELPDLFRTMTLLGISMTELEARFNAFQLASAS